MRARIERNAHRDEHLVVLELTAAEAAELVEDLLWIPDSFPHTVRLYDVLAPIVKERAG